MLQFKSYLFRHRLISFFRDIDVKGFRKLSILLPTYLLPNPKDSGSYILKTIHGFFIRIDPSIDNGVELSLHQTGTYEKGILSFLQATLKKGDCFVDVGANIGVMSIFASQQVEIEGKILAYEAHPKTVELLKENIQLNQLANIQVYQYALGSTESSTKIYDNWQINRGGASLIVKNEQSVSYDIKVHCLDSVFPENTIPKVIKIDVEGFELEVIKGACSIIQKFHPILIIELSENRKNVHASSTEIIDLVKSLGDYQIYKLKGGKERKSKLIEITSDDQLPEHDNVICIPEIHNSL